MKFQETYFIDRALGKLVGEELRKLGVNIELHHDHFPPDCPDTIWIQSVSQKGWIIFTKDDRVSRNPLELQAIIQSNARVFILPYGNMTGIDMASIFVNTIEKIEKFAQGNQAPFIAKVYKDKSVKLYQR